MRSPASAPPSYSRHAAGLELGERFGVGTTGRQEQALVVALGREPRAQLADGTAGDLRLSGAQRHQRAHDADAADAAAAPVGDAFAATEQLEPGDTELVAQRAAERVERGRATCAAGGGGWRCGWRRAGARRARRDRARRPSSGSSLRSTVP